MAINYKDFSFDNVWSGSAHDALTNRLKIAIENYNKQVSNYDKMMEANEMLGNYKIKKSSYESLNSRLSNLNWTDNSSEIQSIQSEMSTLKTEMSSLRSNINSIINSIVSVTSIYNVINYALNDTYSKFLENVCDLSAFYSKSDYTMLSDGTSIYDYYNREEVDNYLASIRVKSDAGSEDVNCARAVMQLAKQVNKDIAVDLDVVTSEVIVKEGNVSKVRKVSFSNSLQSVISTDPYACWAALNTDATVNEKIEYKTVYKLSNKDKNITV